MDLSIQNSEAWLSEKFVGKDRSEIILYLSIVAYVLVFSFITILKHYALKTRAWDLGIFTQSLWTTLNANHFFYHTTELFINPSGSFFGVHFSPILFLVLPLYRVFQRPETLLMLQSFILSLAALPIYKLAKEKVGSRIGGLVFAVAYLTYPAIHFVNLYDFHVQAFLPLFFAYSIYYVAKENWPRYFLFILLALMCEEHAAQITFFIGVYIAWKYRGSMISAIKNRNFSEEKFSVPLVTMGLSAVWYWFTIWQRNTFFPTNPECLGEFLGAGNFAILGAKDPLEVPILIMLRPLNAIQALAYDGHLKLLYIALSFGPLAFFSFKAPSALLPTVPWFCFSLMSQAVSHHALGHQYETYIVSFIFAAAIFAMKKSCLEKTRLKSAESSIKKIIALSLVFFVGASPLSPLFNVFFPNYTSTSIGDHERLLTEVLNMVPPNASILTQDNLFPHVSHRISAYVVPNRFLETSIHDIVIGFVGQTMNNVEYVLVDNKTDPIATKLVFSLLKTNLEFDLIAYRDNGTILLYRRVE